MLRLLLLLFHVRLGLLLVEGNRAVLADTKHLRRCGSKSNRLVMGESCGQAPAITINLMELRWLVGVDDEVASLTERRW